MSPVPAKWTERCEGHSHAGFRCSPLLNSSSSAAAPTPVYWTLGVGMVPTPCCSRSWAARVVAVEPEPEHINGARHRLSHWREYLADSPEPEFLFGRVEDLRELEAAAFDGIFAAECLHHCEPALNALHAMRRVIGRDGRLLILESNAANPAVLWKRSKMTSEPRRILCEGPEAFTIWGNENIRSARQWGRLFHECGFSVSETRYSRHLLAELTRISTSREGAHHYRARSSHPSMWDSAD